MANADKSVFISYKDERADKAKTDFLRGIFDKLKNDGYRVWLDKEEIRAGDSLVDSIQQGVAGCSLFLAFITKSYVKSQNCQMEFHYAANKNKSCIYVMLERLEAHEAKGFDFYLNGGSIRHDAYKMMKDQQFDIDASYKEIIKAFEKAQKS